MSDQSKKPYIINGIYRVKADGTREKIELGSINFTAASVEIDTEGSDRVARTFDLAEAISGMTMSCTWSLDEMTLEQRRWWMDLFGLRFARIRAYVYEKVARWNN